MVALQHLLIGESKRMYQNWKLENVSFEKMLTELKEYARSQKLDGEASKGKQAIDLSRVQNWADEEVVEEHERVPDNDDGTLNPLNVKCYYCDKKGHTITQCTKLQNLKGKGKGRGDTGKVGKGKGKVGGDGKGLCRGKKGPKGGCYTCGVIITKMVAQTRERDQQAEKHLP